MADKHVGKAPLSEAQIKSIRLRKHSQKLRGRNIATGLVIGAFVMGVFGYTIYSVSQERVMDALDEEARFAMSRGPRTEPIEPGSCLDRKLEDWG